MSFLETVENARAFLERNGRVSLRALQREFNLDNSALDELIEELVEIQRVAAQDGRALAWAGGAPPARTETSEPERDPRAYTPKHLADKILQSKSALEGERKQVTVLFADVKGSMELQEGVDPEEWHAILDRFFQVLADGVHRFEGTVNQFTGDGIMALFGAPIAHEDHPLRACYAALKLREDLARQAREVKREHGLNLSTRIGVHSGEVVVGKIGDDLRMDYTAQGHTVGLASRMEELASADSIYLSETTAARVEGFFDLEDLGPFPIKGVSQPVNVFQLQGLGKLRTRFDLSRARGLTRFVGRDADMRVLEDALTQAQAGTGQVVGVVAEAGTGKSRLCFEFVARCRAHDLRVLEGHCVSHGRNIPLLPILEAFRQYYEITDQDTDRQVREKIAGRLLLFDEDYRGVLPLMFDFFGVSDPENPAPRMDPETRQRQLAGILRGLVQRDTTEGSVVTLIEDLHWIDAASEIWLEQWVDAISGTQNLMIVNFRPEYHADWMQKSWYRQLPLIPLGVEAIEELLADLLGADASVATLPARISERTGGNPFFIEEVVQSLVESGSLRGGRGGYRLVSPLEDLKIPGTVESVLAARIDRLGEREKHVLQAASVIGEQFTEPILEAVAELPKPDLAGALGAVKGAEFIYEESLYPVAEYAFKHPLTREVALHTLLQERRRRIHASVARAVEEASPDKLDENAALIAHHWEEAGQDLAAAGWHRRAAEHAGITHPQESFRHWQRVRELSDGLPSSPERDELGAIARVQLLTVGGRISGEDEEMKSLFEEGTELARRSGRDDALGELLGAYGVYRLMRTGNVTEVLPDLERAVELSDRTGDVKAQVNARYNLELACLYGGQYQRAISLGEEAIRLIDRHPDVQLPLIRDFRRHLEGLKSTLLVQMGRLDDAQLVSDSMPPESQTEANSIWAAFTGWLALARGDGPTAVARFQAVLAGEVGGSSPVVVAVVGSELGRAYLLNRDWDQAIATFGQILSTIREQRIARYQEPLVLAGLALARLGRGDPESARSNAEEAVGISRRQGTRAYEATAQVALARALIALGESPEKIEAALSRAAEILDETGALSELPTLCEVRSDLARASGDDAGSERQLREAHRLYTEIGATGHAKRLARELDS